ncbi:type II secretion system F family protein [Thaumasiovibrio subtropicus]|uniref:type II secretion system F family protein n=1 Tax=Thaumasiovibrio subtropicus TaxID=1891207 RepID=UPI000B360D3E|nr:type II secretion system F family protein [Thaumasiovibrio subtropicus]
MFGSNSEALTSSSNKLKHFAWRGVNSNGKKVRGVMMGYIEGDVREKLAQQHIQPQKIKTTTPSFFSSLGNKMNGSDVTAFTRQLATMLHSGVPVVQALKLIADSHKKAEMRATVLQVSKQVEAGMSLSKAFSSASAKFDNFYCDLISTGEETGHLPEVFSRLAMYREKSEALRKKVVKAMIYPTIVSIVAIAVTVGMLIFVIPQFDQIFKSFNAQLPWFTQQVVDLSNLLQSTGGVITVSIVLFVLAFNIALRKSDSFRYQVHKFSLKIPIFGNVILKATIAKFARTLATTFSAGIPLLSGLQSGAQTTTNLHLKTAIEDAHKQTAAGMPLYIALRQTEVFPELMLQMVMIGEESGALDDMLNKNAALYEDDVDNVVDNLSQIMEPFIIVILGGLIGGLLVAMYMPIFSLMSVVG